MHESNRKEVYVLSYPFSESHEAQHQNLGESALKAVREKLIDCLNIWK